MTKKEILKMISDCFDREKTNKEKNSMGVSESYYNPYYLIGTCFTKEELNEMTEEQLKHLLKLSEHASEVFY